MASRIMVRPPSGPALPWSAIAFLLIPVVIGAAAIWVAAGIGANEAAYEREGALAIGVVVDKAIVPGSSDSSDRRLTYTFITPNGRTITARANVSSERYQQTDVGDAVTVTYLSSNPDTNRIGEPMAAWVAYLVGAGGVAMVLLGLGLFTSNVMIRLRRQPSGGIGPQQVEPGVTYVFRRPLSRILVDLLGAPFGAAMFLGGAWFVGIRNVAELDLLTRTAVVLGFGFFGVLLLSGVPYGLRRGLRPAVLEIGPG